MGIEPTWNFVEPHHGFEDQERHQVALRPHGDEPRCGRKLPPHSPAGMFIKRVTPGAVMKQSGRHFNPNTSKAHGYIA